MNHHAALWSFWWKTGTNLCGWGKLGDCLMAISSAGGQLSGDTTWVDIVQSLQRPCWCSSLAGRYSGATKAMG